MVIKKKAMQFACLFFGSFVLFSCQPSAVRSLLSGVGYDGTYVIAYNGEERKLNTDTPPISIGPGVRSMDKDETVLTIVNVGSGAKYTVWFDIVNFTKQSASDGNVLTISRSDIEDHLFSFNHGATIRIGQTKAGVEKEQVEEAVVYNARDLFVWQDLQGMKHDLSENYVLRKDIVFPDRMYVPVGTVDNPFTGTLHGADGEKKIRGIQTSGTDSYQGIFGVVYRPGRNVATVKDLVIENFNVSGVSHVGIVAGWMARGYIENVHAREDNRVQVNGSMEFNGDGYGLGGGLVGLLGTVAGTNITNSNGFSYSASLAGYASVESSSSGAAVRATGTDSSEVGGVAGYAGVASRIINSYATGDVESNDSFVGGLAGYLDGLGSSNYATGDVTGKDYVGGLYGKGGFVNDIYATGNVTGKDYVGGLIGSDSVTDGSAVVGTMITGFATGNVVGDSFVGGLIGRADSNVVGYATGSVFATGSLVGGLVGGSMFNPNFSITGYSRGTIKATDYAGGIYGAMVDENGEALPNTNIVIVGYSRSSVQQNGEGFTHFGRIAATPAVDAGKTYHSILSTESNLLTSAGGEFVDSTGIDGNEIDILADTADYEAMFSQFVFGSSRGEWVWIADSSWPAVFLDGVRSVTKQPVE